MHSRLFPRWVIIFFFVIGLFSAFLFRLIIFLNYIDTFYSRLAWYVGVLGYILFFGFRFYVSHKRRRTIMDNDLIEKIKKSCLDDTATEDVTYILNSIVKSKEMFNYIFIFITSGVAILLDIILNIVL